MYLRAVVGFAIVLLLMVAAHADTTFTYQGELQQTGTVANGSYDMDFALWNALSEGGQIGTTITLTDVPVVDGIFTVELDYGAVAFDNSERWLEIVVNSTTLSPRQPITRTPYSIQTRGIVVDENNNVGIGTSNPIFPLQVLSDGNFAIWARSTSASGRGIYGDATNQNGTSYGVYGVSSSMSGAGVYGAAVLGGGTNYGVYGRSSSNSGTGIFGAAINASGTTNGVWGQSRSTAGRGVFGEATALIGTTHGVFGQSLSENGIGVFGAAKAASGINYGGWFESNSATGVIGYAKAATGDTKGVWGQSESTTGRGIYGIGNAYNGVNYGGFFESRSSTGLGVYGKVNRSSGINYGGRFESASTVGRGVFGYATANSGINYGVVGHSNSSSGYDFWASGAGTDYGSNSSRRWKSNIVPIGDPLSKLAQLRGVYFDWDDEHGGSHDVGMIAEEVGAVLPEIVQYEENGVDAIGMDYSKLTPLLVEAVNALQAENDLLRLEVVTGQAHTQELKDRLERLEAMLLD